MPVGSPRASSGTQITEPAPIASPTPRCSSSGADAVTNSDEKSGMKTGSPRAMTAPIVCSEPGSASQRRRWIASTYGQIGRASCRERVEVGDGGGEVRVKGTEERDQTTRE